MTKKDKNTRFGENSMRIERDQEEQAIGKPQGTSSHIRRSFFPTKTKTKTNTKTKTWRSRQLEIHKEPRHTLRGQFFTFGPSKHFLHPIFVGKKVKHQPVVWFGLLLYMYLANAELCINGCLC